MSGLVRRWLTRRSPRVALRLGLFSPSEHMLEAFRRSDFAETFTTEAERAHDAAARVIKETERNDR